MATSPIPQALSNNIRGAEDESRLRLKPLKSIDLPTDLRKSEGHAIWEDDAQDEREDDDVVMRGEPEEEPGEEGAEAEHEGSCFRCRFHNTSSLFPFFLYHFPC